MTAKDPASIGLSADLQTVLQELGYQTLTPIQAESIPVLLEGKDLIGQAQTGSGKTAAFALPILQKIELDRRVVQALILCPTRELSTQVAREFRRLARRHPGLQVLILSGGQPGRPQSDALRKGVHIVVGTPGRVLDHLDRGNLNLSFLSTLVLDEADRMLDMGFEEEMAGIMNEAPTTRQTVLFSATFPDEIQSISRKYQHEPAHVKIELTEEAQPAIEQLVYDAETSEKPAALMDTLRKFASGSTSGPSSGPSIVFCNQKATVAQLALQLEKAGISCGALHGDLEQFDRDRVLALFRNGSKRVLIATDVAARGLDIPNLDLVINFDLPHSLDDYIHRIGRTGRAGKSGIAVAIVNPSERMRLYDFAKAIGIKMESAKSDAGFEFRRTATAEGQNQKQTEMRTIMISAGRKNKIRPGDILGALTGEAGGLKAESVGKIEIHERLAYVAVASHLAETAVERLQAGRIKGLRFAVKLVD